MWITQIIAANQFIFGESRNKVVANKIWFTAYNGQILEIIVRLAIIMVYIHCIFIVHVHVALLQQQRYCCSCVSNFLCLESFMNCTMLIKEFYILLSSKTNLTVSVVPNIEVIYFVQHSLRLHKTITMFILFSLFQKYFKCFPVAEK